MGKNNKMFHPEYIKAELITTPKLIIRVENTEYKEIIFPLKKWIKYSLFVKKLAESTESKENVIINITRDVKLDEAKINYIMSFVNTILNRKGYGCHLFLTHRDLFALEKAKIIYYLDYFGISKDILKNLFHDIYLPCFDEFSKNSTRGYYVYNDDAKDSDVRYSIMEIQNVFDMTNYEIVSKHIAYKLNIDWFLQFPIFLEILNTITVANPHILIARCNMGVVNSKTILYILLRDILYEQESKSLIDTLLNKDNYPIIIQLLKEITKDTPNHNVSYLIIQILNKKENSTKTEIKKENSKVQYSKKKRHPKKKRNH